VISRFELVIGANGTEWDFGLCKRLPARLSRHPLRSQIQPIVAVHCVDSNDGYAASLPEREQIVRPGAITRARHLTVSASKRGHRVNPERESPMRVRRWTRSIARTRSANLKTCKQARTTYFYEACSSALRADATASKTPVQHPSQCSDPEFRCSVGDVSSTIASSALPPGRLIVRVLSSGCEASRATRRHAERSHRAHHSHAGRNNFEKKCRHRSGRCSDGSGPALMRIAL
jgi:hypothetical protein